MWHPMMMCITIHTIYSMIPITSSSSASLGSTRNGGETKSSDEHMVKEIYGLIDDTLVTTAHIHDLLFQPGSGAYGSDGPCAPAASSPCTSRLPPTSLRGTLRSPLSKPTTTSPSMPRSMSIVGTKASTYQDTLGIPFNHYWEILTTTPEGGDVRHEAFRGGTLMYLLFSPWKWKNTITIYTPRRQVKKVPRFRDSELPRGPPRPRTALGRAKSFDISNLES